jgi:hypothetical protein
MTTTAWPYPTGLEGLVDPQSLATPGKFEQAWIERVDYEIDWGSLLTAGDVIVASTWTSDAGLPVSDGGHTADTATVWVGRPRQE